MQMSESCSTVKSRDEKAFKVLGIEHGSTAVRFALCTFSISENPSGGSGICGSSSERYSHGSIRRIAHAPLPVFDGLTGLLEAAGITEHQPESISIIVLAYGMGDGLKSFELIEKTDTSSCLPSLPAGRRTGVGTAIFNFLKLSNNNGMLKVPVVLVPGLNAGTPWFDTGKRVMYSHLAAPDKVCTIFSALQTFGKNFILAEV
ncbi:MAG: hypothetical protein QW728_04965, partial [Thermoplasmata archaeon]